MEGAQSLNYGLNGSEMDFDVLQMVIDGQSLHADMFDHTKALTDDINETNGAENAKTPDQDLNLTWLNGLTTLGKCKRFESIDELAIGASEGFPDKTDSEDLANGLSIPYMNSWTDVSHNKLLENRTNSESVSTNNGQLIGDDFAFSKHRDVVGAGEISHGKRKTIAETLTNSDNIDRRVQTGDEMHQNLLKSLEGLSANFERKKSKQSSFVSNGGREDMECTQTYSKRKRAKMSDTVDGHEFGTQNLTSMVSNERVTQFASVAGRGRNAKTRNRRSETGFSATFDDSSPVPSPEAEVPNGYIDDDALINLETKELNRRVKHLSKAKVIAIKHRRRTLKNRGYARSCREKKMTETSTLQRSNGDLEKDLASKRLELHLTLLQREEWKRKYEELASACKKYGIQVEP